MRIAESLIHGMDETLNGGRPRAARGSLHAFLFHILLADRAEADLDLVNPQQRTTVDHLRTFLERALEAGLTFVRAADIAAGLDEDGRYAWLTFDDGYYNNARALPLLEEYGVPMTLFVSTGHVLAGESFWGDVLYRESRARGVTADRIHARVREFLGKTHAEIESTLAREFGREALAPRSELDRPFTPDELADFSRHPLVELGNHTRKHAMLPNYPLAEARAQIAGADDDLEQITGSRPLSISYPVGMYNDEIVSASIELGLQVGVTVKYRRDHLPLRDAGHRMRLGRFIIWGEQDIKGQIASYVGPVSTYRSLWNLRESVRGRNSR